MNIEDPLPCNLLSDKERDKVISNTYFLHQEFAIRTRFCPIFVRARQHNRQLVCVADDQGETISVYLRPEAPRERFRESGALC
jgi:hypothetical protein